MIEWYLLKVRTRSELTVGEALSNFHPIYCPTAKVEKVVRGKRQEVDSVLFPGYLFVRIDLTQTKVTDVLRFNHVSSFVRSAGVIKPVGLDVVVHLRSRLEELQKKARAIAEMKPGAKVVINDGPLASLEAIFHEPDGAKRSFLLVEMLGKTQKVSLSNSLFDFAL